MTTGRGSLYQSILTAAHRWPEAAALDFDTEVVTYAELASLVESTAARVWRECTDEGPIGLCAARGPALYVGYLSALRLGRPVVPLSPTTPRARNLDIARYAGVDLVLTDAVGEAALAERGGVRTLRLDPLRAAGTSTAKGFSAPSPADAESAVAYILFTSGSTGRAKGVPIQAGNVHAFVDHAITRYRLGPGCRVSQTFEITFDPSVLDLMATWTAGGTVVVPRRKEHLVPGEYARRRGLTHWFSVPSVITLADQYRAIPKGSLTGLRCSVFMGEPLSLTQAALWHEAAPNSTIENAFGPTELTVLCTGYQLPVARQDWPRTSNDSVPIGTAFDHLESVVLDEAGHPAAEGELCVRGAQRFDGYLNHADDLGRFVTIDTGGAHQVAGGARPSSSDWYRTGDRVRVEADVLVHIGRVDRQVKLNGQRVELGEVEAELRRYPGVSEAAVVVVNEAGGQVRLHAVLGGDPGDDRALTARLRSRLPDYMCPRSFSWLDRLPLNPNGKVDHEALRLTYTNQGQALTAATTSRVAGSP